MDISSCNQHSRRMDITSRPCLRHILETSLEISAAFEMTRRPIGDKTILVVDGVLKEPDALFEIACDLDYGLGTRGGEFRNYVGKRATIGFHPSSLHNLCAKLAADILGEPVAEYERLPLSFTKVLRSEIQLLHPRQKVPHIDDGTSFAAVLYLTDDRRGGTAFYKHNRTGLTYLPPHPDMEICELMRQSDLRPTISNDYLTFIKSIMYEGIEDYAAALNCSGIPEGNEIWHLLELVEARRNRMVVFPAGVFHSPVVEGANNDTMPRMTLNLFLNPQ